MISTTALDNYLAHLQANDTFSNTHEYGYAEGKKYYKVYREFNSQKGVISFVDIEDGTIYKAKDWKSASKTVLGNVSDYQQPVEELPVGCGGGYSENIAAEPNVGVDLADEVNDEISRAIANGEIGVTAHFDSEYLTSDEVIALEAKLEQDSPNEALPEASQDDEQATAADEVMSPQELLVEAEEWFVMIPGQDPVGGFTSSTQAREFAEKQGLKQGTYSIRDKQYVGSRLSEDKLGRLLAEGLKEIADKHDKKAMASKKAGASTTRGNLYISPKDAAQIKPIKAGSKHHVLVTHLLQGATLTELAQATNWKPASVRSAFSYDINSIKGYGVRQEGDKFYLVMPAGVNAPVVQ